MVVALCKLHNFLVDRLENKVCPSLVRDQTIIELIGGFNHGKEQRSNRERFVDISEAPDNLVGGGEHFEDVSVYERRKQLMVADHLFPTGGCRRP